MTITTFLHEKAGIPDIANMAPPYHWPTQNQDMEIATLVVLGVGLSPTPEDSNDNEANTVIQYVVSELYQELAKLHTKERLPQIFDYVIQALAVIYDDIGMPLDEIKAFMICAQNYMLARVTQH